MNDTMSGSAVAGATGVGTARIGDLPQTPYGFPAVSISAPGQRERAPRPGPGTGDRQAAAVAVRTSASMRPGWTMGTKRLRPSLLGEPAHRAKYDDLVRGDASADADALLATAQEAIEAGRW